MNVVSPEPENDGLTTPLRSATGASASGAQASPRGDSSTPWRCRHGWHDMAFVSMSNVRDVTVQTNTIWLCELVEQCRRCGLRSSNPMAPKPKRVKVR